MIHFTKYIWKQKFVIILNTTLFILYEHILIYQAIDLVSVDSDDDVK